MSATFFHVHQSGKFSTTKEQVHEAALKATAHASIYTGTEVITPHQAEGLKINGFGLVIGNKNPRDDCFIMYDEMVWTKLHGATHQLSNKTYFTADGRATAPACGAFAVLKHKSTGQVMVVAVWHSPPSVESARGMTGVAGRVRAWRDEHKGFKQHWNTLCRRYNTNTVLVCGDWNLDLKRPVLRTLVKALQPGLVLAWSPKALSAIPSRVYKNHFPGTHGTRLIDATYLRGKVVAKSAPKILPRPFPVFDHNPYRELLGFNV